MRRAAAAYQCHDQRREVAHNAEAIVQTVDFDAVSVRETPRNVRRQKDSDRTTGQHREGREGGREEKSQASGRGTTGNHTRARPMSLTDRQGPGGRHGRTA